MTRVLFPRETWRWQGSPGHFILGDRCVYHLNTVVGPWLVSTVGELRDAWRDDFRPVGHDRMFETMVFRAGSPCTEDAGCGEVHIASPECLAMRAANNRREAEAAHLEVCDAWSRKALS